MNEKLVTRVAEFVGGELEPGEGVLTAVRGDLMVSVKVSTQPGTALGNLLDRRKLRRTFEDSGLPLPNVFILALTPKRLQVLQTGTGARPKRFVSAVPLSAIASVQLGKHFAAIRFAQITMADGVTLPMRLVRKDDPDGFVEAFAVARAAAASPA